MKKYQKIVDKPILYCDVDDTLVMWPAGGQPVAGKEHEYVSISDIPRPVLVKPHKEHINLLRQFHARGHSIVVWSAGGAEWAEKVVQVLQLEKYVDLIVSKPTWYYDDLFPDLILPHGTRIYKEDDRDY